MSRGLILLTFLAILNSGIVARVAARTAFLQSHAALTWGIGTLLFIIEIAPFLARNYLPQTHLSVLNWVSYIVFGVMSILLIYLLVAEVVQFAVFLFTPADINKWVLIALLGATGATTLYGLYGGLSPPVVKRVDITLPGLPAAFDGFTIAQISDLHLGETLGAEASRQVVELTNAAKPDLIAMTGDMIDGRADTLAPDVAPLANLRAPQGVYFITGNHEYYRGAAAWVEAFRKLGARVLINEHVVLRRGNDAIVLAGVTDYATGHMLPGHASDPAKAAQGAPEGLVKILLAHQPASYVEAKKAGYALQLSGHTHGGQYFPFTQIIRFFHRYYKGLNRDGDFQLYINTGTGYWGPPLKMTPREITLVTLRR